MLDKIRSEISKRAWRIRKRLGGKGKCVYCHRSIFAGGMTFKGRPYHKTCLSFLKMGLTPKQAGLENPQSIADWWNSRRLSFQNELLYFLGYEHDWEREWNLLKPDVKAVITKWYKIYESKQVANPQSLECPSCHNPIENPKRLRVGWCPNCGAKVGVRNPEKREIAIYKGERVGVMLRVGDSAQIWIPSRQEGVWVKADKLQPVKSNPNPLNGFIGFYKGKRYEIYADTSYHAQQEIAKKYGIKKPYEITVMLAEEDGKPVTHVADFNPRPPSAWWTSMMPRVRAQYPKFGKERLSQILGGIWYKYPEGTRARIIREYD